MGRWVDGREGGREGRLLKRGQEDMNRQEEGDGGQCPGPLSDD